MLQIEKELSDEMESCSPPLPSPRLPSYQEVENLSLIIPVTQEGLGPYKVVLALESWELPHSVTINIDLIAPVVFAW